MKSTKVSLKLDQRSVENKIEFAKNIVLSMTGNSNFATPVPALASVTTAANTLDAAKVAAMDGGKSKTAAMHQAEAVLNNLLGQLGNYVEATANAAEATGGNAVSVITSAGLDYRKISPLATTPDAPLNVRAGATKSEGEISIGWDKVKGAHAYVIEISTDPGVVGARTVYPGGAVPVTPSPSPVLSAIFTLVKIISQRKFILSGLDSATKYALRVYAVGTHGYSPYSNVVVAKSL